jgi:hypothetical protein
LQQGPEAKVRSPFQSVKACKKGMGQSRWQFKVEPHLLGREIGLSQVGRGWQGLPQRACGGS